MIFDWRYLLYLVMWSAGNFSGDTKLDIRWNVPTFQCLRTYNIDFEPLLRSYGILVNKGDQFKGEEITIFYESQLGLYPSLDGGVAVNGGIPQEGNLHAHLKKAATDISTAIPNNDFEGLGVIDWESWRPVWDFNWGTLRKYQEKSFQLEEEKHPGWRNDSIIKSAEREWEKSARNWMLETLRLGQKMRPNGLWCYYLFPDCYNYEGQTPEEFKCPPIVRKGNEKLSWLWDESSAVCPSLYLVDGYLQKYTIQQRTWYVNGRLQEAVRLAPKAQLYPYIGYGIIPGVMVPEVDFWRILAQAASAGSSGIVIWGSSASLGSKVYCELLKSYIMDVLGPAVRTVVSNAERCAKEVCNDNGRCTWPNDPNVQAWRHYIDAKKLPFDKSNIICRCQKRYSGKFCEKIY